MAGAGMAGRVTVIGTGVIGAGWAARFLAHGYEVFAWDPGSHAKAKLVAAVARAWPALERLGLPADADQSRLRFKNTLEAACAESDFVQESAPEELPLKGELLSHIDQATPDNTIIGSSTSGFKPSDLQRGLKNPERLVVGHPFNPVYLLPLVEVVAGESTSQDTLTRAIEFYKSISMDPLHVRNEIDGHLADRLLEAQWREILHLVNDGIATTGELDDAITYGPGLRWAFMGTNLTYHLAGGNAGMRAMLQQFGPALKLPWTKLEAPELTDDLVDRMVEGTQAQAGNRSITELETLRDNCLVDIMRALETYKIGAGQILANNKTS